jgi:hypothetical protein
MKQQRDRVTRYLGTAEKGGGLKENDGGIEEERQRC